ncbi:MAG: hypothetical protein IPM07_25305 [Anaerolineales bacterium]|nr:hypothetical protein [Anaerolineales bacterium]
MVNSLEQFVESGHISNNLTFYRLNGFVGSRRHLLTIHEWLTGGDDLPAIAISGEQGAGKSTLAVASAWNHYYDFSDGIIQVSPAGASPFRLYDVVRTMDTVLGTALTRTSDNRWGISILEQLYKRRRLLILDKLAGASEREVATLVEIIGHLHENEGQSRIILIDRKFNPNIAALVQHQHLHLDGILREDLDAFVAARAPQRVLTAAHAHAEAIYAAARGNPICMRLIFGLMEEFPFSELDAIFRGISGPDGGVPASSICAFALETYALQNPAAGVFLNRLVRAVGGVYEPALRELFWADLGSHEDYAHTVSALADRALIERDRFRGRVVIHPLVRRYLEENTAMLGEEWDRRHAAFYVKQAEQYQMLPLQRWSEVDLDWGNIFAGADWCSNRLTRIFQREPEAMLSDDAARLPNWRHRTHHPRFTPTCVWRLTMPWRWRIMLSGGTLPAFCAGLPSVRSRRWQRKTCATMPGCSPTWGSNIFSSGASRKALDGSSALRQFLTNAIFWRIWPMSTPISALHTAFLTSCGARSNISRGRSIASPN